MSSIKIDAFCPVGIGGTKGIDTTKLKLFVGGLLQKHTSKDLYDLFIKYGTIRESVVIPDRFRVRSRCYGFITFESEQSVRKALKNAPITTLEGIKLTVILAAENTKPRRAHFNVKHGISGHKPLPNVYEKGNENRNKNETKKYIIKKTKINSKESIGIYTDPSLFRTANIQQIAPAKFEIENENTNENNWPNEDIQKDFKYLKKVKVFNDSKYKNKKHWKLISTKRNEPINKYFNYKSNKNNNNNSDDIRSMKSCEWTPIDRKNKSNVIQGENDHQIEKEIELVSEGKLSYNSLALEEFGNENNKKQISFSDNFRNNYTNGLWSPYQPNFTPIANTQNYCNFSQYNFQNMIPTPPIQPIQPISNIMNAYSNYQNYKNYSPNPNEQMNYNNYFCNNSVRSSSREI